LAGFGAIPKPTVKSGWEKMKVAVARSKSRRMDVYSSMPNLSLKRCNFEGVLFWLLKELADLSSTWDESQRREEL